MASLRIDVWSDIACPWCYIGKRRLERALSQFADAVEVDWHAFELDPSAPRELQSESYAERLARKYGTSLTQAQAMIDRVIGIGLSEGLHFDYSIIRSGNTFDAHRLLAWACKCGLQGGLKERLLCAYFCEGAAVSDHDTLVRLAGEVGLDTEGARVLLAGDAYAAEVREDESQAKAMGINGVPFFVIAEKFGVSGAQPAEILLEALGKAQLTLALVAPSNSEGAICGPDGC